VTYWSQDPLHPRPRALTPQQVQRVADALANGVPPSALAAEYGVSTRTVYRAREMARQEWLEVVVGGWRAQFVLTDGGPVRVTPWWAL
jgi:DNA invertase Pin-like site-specific DNA recombinase